MVFMPHWPVPLGAKPIDFGLERIEQLLERLGNPHHKLPPVVHVAGTNGKGSTIAFLKSIIEAAGYAVHSYTSPHLLNFNERITLAGQSISDNYLFEILEACKEAAGDDIPITFFEGTTAAAFLAFSRRPADIVLLETGLGGRLDATNMIDQPLLTMLSPISIDHTEYLGPTIAHIAAEKVEIMKQNVPCVVSLQQDEVLDIIEAKAVRTDSRLLALGFDWYVEPNDKGRLVYADRTHEETVYSTPALAGSHQYINAGAAITAAKHLRGFNVSDDAINKGLENTQWPARLQRLSKGGLTRLLPKNCELWLDGAHNDAGAHVLGCSIEDWQAKDPRTTYLVMGMTRGRDVARFLSFMKEHIAYVGGILVETEPSALSSKQVADGANAAGINADPHDSIEDAIAYIASTHDATTPARIIITGSLYLSSDALKANE